MRVHTNLLSLTAAIAVIASTPAFGQMYSRTMNSSSQKVTAPPDSARPGEKFFSEGVTAVRKNDYKYAIDRYEAAASWAYKPAQYNLGVIYFTGAGGIPENHALGLAWLALAAERGDKTYVAARDTAYTKTTDQEFAHANELWRDMKKTYGDKVALKRAETRWRQVRNSATGSHLGAGMGHLSVGGRDRSGVNVVNNPKNPTSTVANTATQSAAGITGADAVDGSVAYRQMRESDNPYDVKFKEATGEVKVLDVIPIDASVLRKPESKPPH